MDRFSPIKKTLFGHALIDSEAFLKFAKVLMGDFFFLHEMFLCYVDKCVGRCHLRGFFYGLYAGLFPAVVILLVFFYIFFYVFIIFFFWFNFFFFFSSSFYYFLLFSPSFFFLPSSFFLLPSSSSFRIHNYSHGIYDVDITFETRKGCV